MSRVTKSLWRYFTRSTAVVPQVTDIIPLAVQPGTDMITDISHCTVADLAAVIPVPPSTVIVDYPITDLDGTLDGVFIDPANFNLFRTAQSGKNWTLYFDIALGDASGGAPRPNMLLGLPVVIPQTFDGPNFAVYFTINRFGASVGPVCPVFAGGGNFIGGRNYLQMGSVINYNTGLTVDWTAAPGSDHIIGQLDFTTV
jgi:hypothetical protein